MAAHFAPPVIQDNPSGWGPCAVPTEFQDIPYQPFSKGDRIGKISDWTGQFQDRNKYHSQFAGGSQYAYYHEGDESTFRLVDTSKPQKTAYQKNRQRFNNARLKREREKQQRKEAFMMGQVQQRGKQQRKSQKNMHYRRYNDRQQTQKNRNASVVVRDSWKVVEEMDFPRLAKLKLPDVPPPEDLYNAGAVEFYDKMYDRISTKNPKVLESNSRTFHRVTTTDDPIIRKLTSKGNVFGTDAIISTLMCCTRSVHSWDIIVQRVGKKLFFDKRDDPNFDLLPVYETTQEELKEEGINSPYNLAVEATYINQNFSQQCLKKSESVKFEHPNPFAEDKGEEVASVGYRYRRYTLGEGINLVIRCEHDAALPNNQFLSIKALNEFDPRLAKIDWRQKLDSQIGSVLATELKNNSNKMAKWTCNAILAGSALLKIGYVSRVAMHDTTRHVILSTQQFNPKSFAAQIALDMDNAWGILRVIVDTCLKMPEGKYLLLRDPNKGVVRLYDIPDNTFESDEDSGSSDEGGDDSSDEENTN
ncbi:eukaryotic translation initiation factor 3 subunit D-like [Hydractinia symbiolongicarpus]|uniref:eukaryotic translation initiation factor 3 subunit D-like n=1 Tax=Hydractinia symbiolongicarpus TaxID=13093 RepID=UPI00254B97D1|nr:eukaryotic translation initiation factor 3 subunit D-like [Hydractinia symbiolongicarpus]